MDSNTRPGSDLPTGKEAFQEAIKPQEGQFMRGATWILNDPKDLDDKTRHTDNNRLAAGLVARNALGHFVKRT